MITAKSLSRSFGSINAVDDISFSVNKGEILGFLGPNGAGKSTTMKMITSFLSPTSGTVSVGGFDVINDPLEVRAQIGYLPESSPSYKDMNVYDFLMFTSEIRGFDGKERINKVKDIMETCNLKEVAFQQIETLSKGYRQRVGFAQAFLHDPDYLILDEPTDGLDPNQKQEVRNLIKKMGQEKCIILSTHILEEVEAVCNRVIIIGNGKIVADGTPEELKSKSKLHGAVTLRLKGTKLEDVISDLEKINGVDKVIELPLENKKPISSSDIDADVSSKNNNVESESESKNHNESSNKNKSDSKDNAEKRQIIVRAFPMCSNSIAQEIATFIHKKNWIVDGFSVEKGDLNEVFYNLTIGGKSK